MLKKPDSHPAPFRVFHENTRLQIPAPRHEEMSLVIEFCYGSEVSAEIVDAIATRCDVLKER
jgi:hypothetical protein